MALRKISELNQVFKGNNVIEWQSPGGIRYRYERDRSAVGQEEVPGAERYNWYVLTKNDATTAKRRVFELINEDEF